MEKENRKDWVSSSSTQPGGKVKSIKRTLIQSRTKCPSPNLSVAIAFTPQALSPQQQKIPLRLAGGLLRREFTAHSLSCCLPLPLIHRGDAKPRQHTPPPPPPKSQLPTPSESQAENGHKYQS